MRRDIGLDACQLSARTQCAKVEDILKVNKVVTSFTLIFTILNNVKR